MGWDTAIALFYNARFMGASHFSLYKFRRKHKANYIAWCLINKSTDILQIDQFLKLINHSAISIAT